MTFEFPKRFDEQEAKKGVWFDVYDEFDQYYGSYLCRHYNKHSATSKLMVDRYNRVHRKELNGSKTTSDEADAHFLVHTVLMDWKHKENGKNVAFTPAKAYEILSKDGGAYVVEFLFACAKNVANYRAPADDAEAVQDEVSKN